MCRNLLIFAGRFLEHRDNFNGGYIQPLTVRIYAHNCALGIAFMGNGVRGQHFRHEIVLLFAYMFSPLLQSSDFTVFLSMSRG